MNAGGVTDVPGVRVGHWTDSEALTGCTVVILPAGTVASGEVRGGAPGTREWALLDPRRTVAIVNAVVMTGGSAFGLAACDGAVRWCEERGMGYPTPAGPVPIVVGMVLFDLGVGDPTVRPGPEQGYAACVHAQAGTEPPLRGRVGAGTGATIAKWRGRDAEGFARPAGIGSAVARSGDLVVSALVAVNAFGEPRGVEPEGPRVPVFPGERDGRAWGWGPHAPEEGGVGAPAGPNVTATTIGVVVTNAALDKAGCRLAAESGHDGLARALEPAHTAGDGDALVVAATGPVESHVETVRALTAWSVEQAILDACR
ncbi:MAG TPA: P1 family peptidase [Acidimicrobiales bacterium]|nr:P1 family peptidase [Acidimicrobiales bacterium]